MLLCSRFDFYSRRWVQVDSIFPLLKLGCSTSCKWFRADESLCSHLFFTFATRKAVILSNKNPCVYILCIYLLYIVYIYDIGRYPKTLVLPTIYIFGAWPRGHPWPLSVAPKNSTARRLIQKPMERMVIQESWWRYNPCFRGHEARHIKVTPIWGIIPNTNLYGHA